MPRRSEDDIDLDEVLADIGQFGWFQVRQYALMVLPIMFNAFFTLSYVFTAGNLNYRCLVPGCEDAATAVYQPPWLNASVPMVNGLPERCQRFVPLWNGTNLPEDGCRANLFDRQNVLRCDNFVYEDSEVTIVRDFNVTCPENDWKLSLVGTINNVGQFVALPIAGYVSDRYGRRLVLLISIAGSALFGLIRSFATSYEMFLVMEFLDPTIGSTMYTTAFVLALELVGPKMRVTGNNIISCAFTFGEAFLGLFAMLLKNWRILLRVLYIPGFISLSFIWTTAESVRWLLSKGKKEQALQILQRVAKANGRTLSPAAVESFCPSTDSDSKSDELDDVPFTKLLQDAFSNPQLVLRVINCSFCWLTNTMVYFGLSLNSVTLAGDKYLNFILVSLIELPGFFLMQMILDRAGRRRTLFTTLVLSGLFCIISEFIPSEIRWLGLVMFLLSKLTITMSFGTLYIYTVEIFPTNLRQSLLSTCSMFGRIGSMVAPQTPLLAKIWKPLPMVLFGCLGLTSGLAILQFPETLNTELPNTLEEAINMKDKRDADKPNGLVQ